MTRMRTAKRIVDLAVAVTFLAGPAHAEGVLNLLTWEGYADASFVQPFEAATGCKVTATLVGSNDDYIPKLMAGGGAYDLVTPTIDTTKALILNDLVDPLDLSRLPAFADIFDQFKTLEGINHEGKIYTFCCVYSFYSTFFSFYPLLLNYSRVILLDKKLLSLLSYGNSKKY